MTPFQRCLLRTAADAAGLPDGPDGDISIDTGERNQELVLARNLAVCVLTFAGFHEYTISQLVPNHYGFRRIRELQRPPLHLLQCMHNYGQKMFEQNDITDEEVELLQIHTERWFDTIKPSKC